MIGVKLVVIGLVISLSVPTAWSEEKEAEKGGDLAAIGEFPPQQKSAVESSYSLHTGDRINIKIYPEDEYIKGAEMEVSSEGNITLPLVGKIPVAGKTVIDAEKEIVAILAKDFIVNPEVVIEVLEHKKQTVVVLGQVKKPGTYNFSTDTSSMTLLQAISLAGGFSEIANIKKIRIMRKRDGKSEALQANAEAIIAGKDKDIDLEPGDIVNVSESLF